MNTLIIYDNQGQIFSKIEGFYDIPNGGIQFLEIEMPQGKIVKGVDTTIVPHQAILEDAPPTEVYTLKQELAQTNADLLGLMDYLGQQGLL